MDLLILAPLRRAGHLERHPLLGARVRPRRGPAAVLLGQGESAGRALELASRLCAVTGQELLVMYRDHTGTPPEVLHRALADRLGVAPVAWRTHELAATSALPDACRQLRVATLVLPADDALAGPHALLELRGALECPLLLVR
jgi:hypothetical protein